MANKNNTTSKVTEFKEKLKKQAEDLVTKDFPDKILLLESMLATQKFNREKLSDVHADLNIPKPSPPVNDVVGKKRKHDSLENNFLPIDGSKVLVLPYGTVPCNSHIVELVDEIKPHIRQLVEDTNILKMWVQFLIPRIEDGNNFGVSIQEDALGEIRTVEGEAAAFFDQLSRYFLTRAKMVTKVAKYPHIDDYRRTVEELDEKEFVSLRLVLCELRNHYSTLHDLITKNMEKIKQPRTSNSDYRC